jgi:hypothetical protein
VGRVPAREIGILGPDRAEVNGEWFRKTRRRANSTIGCTPGTPLAELKHLWLSPAAERVFATLDGLTAAQLAVIEPQLKPWVRQQYRLRRRDRAIIAAAGLYFGRLASGRAIADELEKDLGRFRPRSRPETGKRRLLSEVLRLNRGRILGSTAIREVLAGKNRRQLASNPAMIPG